MMNDEVGVGKIAGYRLWLLLILLTAVFLRLYQLDNIPPGLTHDEADHGLTAVSILNGTREIYFTIGHGREPLFDYATAGLMGLLGQTSWVLRGTAVFFSLLMIAATAAWSRLAFNKRVALFTAAGLAVGFWPVMAGRQALRSITLPTLFALALTFFWHGLQKTVNSKQYSLVTRHSPLATFLLSGIFLGLTFYTYIPARGMWLLFPALLLLGALLDRTWLRRVWPRVILLLAVAGGLATPLFAYLGNNPDAEIRIQELSEPLTAVLQGDFSLLWANIKAGLAIFTVSGDTAWRYNISGRPLLTPLLGILFYGGIVLALWQLVRWDKRPLTAPSGKLAYAAALIWLLGGLAPVLITGAELSMTQGMGMQPLLYLFPALMLDWVWYAASLQVESGRWRVASVMTGGMVLLFGATAVITARDYFGTWANTPEVRVQYESTMTAVIGYLNEQPQTETAVSTIAPDPFHTPALAQMMLHNSTMPLRWFDGRGSLLLPQADDALIIFSGYTQLPTALEPYIATAVLQDTLPLQPNDEDRPVWVYRLAADEAVASWQSWLTPEFAQFGNVATLVGYDLHANQLAGGEVAQLITVWHLQTELSDLRLFTHLVGSDGVPLAQADRLDAPSNSWVKGDWLVQLHQFVVPQETAVGRYPLTIGLYYCLDIACKETERLPVNQNGTVIGDNLQLTEMVITE
ncbi:MAG: glycosyltransferase family 39 protein [Chloroflexi bacterium]|nr:glycosyltransferase family 39 protein [Chloroflexota bacterium]